MKIIKRKICLLMLTICLLVGATALFTVQTTPLKQAQAQIEIINNLTDPLAVVSSVEEELREAGTSILKVLQEQRDFYAERLSEASEETKEITLGKLTAVDEAIARFYVHENGDLQTQINEQASTYGWGFAPNCTCTQADIAMDTPCARCIEYKNTSEAVGAIAAGFKLRGWELACDLLWFNTSNKTIDVDYWPELGYTIAEAPQIANDLAYNNELAIDFDQDSPGRLNGLFASTIEGDTYNSLGDFYYTKTYAGNGTVDIDIIDRYDWGRGPGGSAGAINDTMVLAQELGILTPFYTRIQLTIPGYVPYDWQYTSDGVAITGIADDITAAEIPTNIKDMRIHPKDQTKQPDVNITSIAAGAFAGKTGITSVVLPEGVTTIGDNAFAGCTALRELAVSDGVTSIGQGVFKGCNVLQISVSAGNPNYTAQDNVLYNKNKTAILASGKAPSDINIPGTISEIAPYAFADNTNVETLKIEDMPTIGQYAFAGCGSLAEVYFYSYTVPTMGANAFLNSHFTLYAPHSKQPLYESAFLGTASSIASIPIEITFVSEGDVVDKKSTYYGATIPELSVPFKQGYDFAGWFDPLGTEYKKDGLWDTTEDLTVYAKFTPKTFYLIFDGLGSEALEDQEVKYDAPVGPLPVIDIDGFRFDGWKDKEGNVYTKDTIYKKLRNVTLTSDVFSETYTVVFDKQSGTGGADSVNARYLMPMPSTTAPTRYGYTFQGYFSEPEGQGTQYYYADMSSAENWNIPEGRTLYAYWIGDPYTVTLDNQYSEKFNTELISMSSGQVNYIIFIPSSSGTITLWTSHTSGDPYLILFDKKHTMLSSNDDGYGNLDSKITYSVVGGNRYLVGFRALNASKTIGQVHYSGVSIGYSTIFYEAEVRFGSAMPTQNILAPTKTGYRFLQYNTDRNGQGTSYYYGPNVASDSKWDRTTNTTLYAVWEKISYNVTLDLGYGDSNVLSIGYKDEVTASYPYVMNRVGYDFHGFYSGRNGSGTKYFGYRIKYIFSDYHYELQSTGQRWNVPADGVLYAYWTIVEGDYTYPIVISNADEPNQYRSIWLRHGSNVTITAPTIDGYTFEDMNVNGEFRGTNSFTLENVQLRRNLGYGIDGFEDSKPFYLWYPGYGSPPMNQGGLFMKYAKDSCVAEGTLITLADGTQKAVEKLSGDEMLLVWNMFTGTFDAAPILFIDSEPARINRVIYLYFSDGTVVKVIDEHGFWDHDLDRYVFLREDAAQYIGHSFQKQITNATGAFTSVKVRLENVVIREEKVSTWSPVTYGHLCYYVNGMLSMPGATEGLIDIFDVDAEKMKIDQAAFEADIATYGLFTYEEFNRLFPVPEVIFDAFGGQYLKVSIGKGLTTVEELGSLIGRYAKFFPTEEDQMDAAAA